MIKRVLATATFVIALPPFTAAAQENIDIQDEIIVTASRTAQPWGEVGSAVDILTSADIVARQSVFAADLLRDLPGLAVNRSGPAGAFTQVRMRGAESNHTLVLIDGIEAGDPFNIGEFEFAHLTTDLVSRIEVLRGPQSALWGSEAIGGVINVTTGRPDAAGPWAEALLEGGSFGTVRTSGRAGSAGSWGRVNAAAGYTDIRGISASPTGPERDGYNNFTASLSTTFTPNERLTLNLAGRYVEARAEEDEQDFDFLSPTQGQVIDSDGERDSERFYARAAATLSAFDGLWSNTVSAALTDTDNTSYSGGAFSFGSEGRKWDLEYRSDATFEPAGSSLTHGFGSLLEYEDQVYEYSAVGGGPENQRQSIDQWATALEYRLGIDDRVFLTAAVRHDGTERFADETTYRVTTAWQAGGGVKLRASYGTGVAQPGFYELFGFDPTSFIGNPNLQPEKSKGWDAGVDIAFADGSGLASFTYFDANLKNEIFTDFAVFPFTADNRAGTSTRDGFEASLHMEPAEYLRLAAAYTYTDAKDDFGIREVRRPRHAASVNITYEAWAERLTLDLGLDYNGAMDDNEFIFATPEDRVRLKSYVIGSLAASFDVTDQVQLTARLENLFDDTYQEVFGYAAPGLGAYVGLKIATGS